MARAPPPSAACASEGAELVVTVDCGAAAHDALAAAAEIGLEVVVIDHHLMRETPPDGAALVNPNRPDCASGQGVLAAAGVTFVLLAALNREARRRGLFADRPEPDLRQWLDLAALGAICDVTQLVGFNRALAAQGLKVMSGWANPGLAALMEVAGAKRAEASVFHAGFILGPRINAGGRIGRADLGARLLVHRRSGRGRWPGQAARRAQRRAQGGRAADHRRRRLGHRAATATSIPPRRPSSWRRRAGIRA